VAGLGWSTAATIAWREARSSRSKFFFVLISIAIGVAALTGVRGFSAAFRRSLTTQARSIMAGDLSARTNQRPTPAEQSGLDEISRSGIVITPVTEMVSMGSATGSFDPILVSLKAVDPSKYPFYGTVDLNPSIPLTRALTPDTVAVGDDLLLRLHLKVGDSIRLGTQPFRIVAEIVEEPDRLSGSFAAGPRVLLSQQALERTGLLAPGSHASRRFLFKLPNTNSDAAVDTLKTRVETLLPEAQVTDYRESNPSLTQGLDRATGLLSLISLTSLVLGAVGVAMSMRAHLQQRLDTIAIMKALGARSGHILRIYFIQTLALGIAGGLLGVALGIGVQAAFPLVLGKMLHLTPDLRFDLRSSFVGLAAGVTVTLLFTLPPLLDIRGIRPLLILRRDMEEGSEKGLAGFFESLQKSLQKNWTQILAIAVLLAGVAILAIALSDSAQVGRIFSIGLALVLLALIGLSSLLLGGLRMLLARTRLRLPSVLRHGLANLYRPGNPTAPLLAALGLGVTQIVMVFLVQHAIVSDLNVSALPTMSNVFLVDMATSEVPGVRALLQKQPGITTQPELLPIVSSRLLAVDGVPAAQLKLAHMPRRMLQSLSISSSLTVPTGTKVVRGAWWDNDGGPPEIAVDQHAAARLGLHLGDTMTLAAQDSRIEAHVVALTESDGRHAFSRTEYMLQPSALAGLPTVWYGGVHVAPDKVASLERAMYTAYPTVTMINVAQTLETVRQVVLQISYVVQFLAAFSIFAGIVILASSIAGTRYRRMREVAVLKTLGATRGRIALLFSIEFAVLGLVSGIVGVLFANILAHFILSRFTLNAGVEWGWSVLAALLTAALAVAAGWAASSRILEQRPLAVLQQE
jgi:putative ABC transport system permease protein